MNGAGGEGGMADGSVRRNYCTHHLRLFPPPPLPSPSSSACSGGRQPAFVKVKGTQPTPDDTTEQFFNLFRSATPSLLSVQFQHLEAMPKCKASRNVRKMGLINVRPCAPAPAPALPAFRLHLQLLRQRYSIKTKDKGLQVPFFDCH